VQYGNRYHINSLYNKKDSCKEIFWAYSKVWKFQIILLVFKNRKSCPMQEYRGNGFLLNNLFRRLKHLAITNAIIVKKHGCRPTLKSHLSKDAKVVTDIFTQPICGKIFIKRNIMNFKKKLYLIIRSRIWASFVKPAKGEFVCFDNPYFLIIYLRFYIKFLI
jgi:hypothetical protein